MLVRHLAATTISQTHAPPTDPLVGTPLAGVQNPIPQPQHEMTPTHPRPSRRGDSRIAHAAFGRGGGGMGVWTPARGVPTRGTLGFAFIPCCGGFRWVADEQCSPLLFFGGAGVKSASGRRGTLSLRIGTDIPYLLLYQVLPNFFCSGMPFACFFPKISVFYILKPG